MARIRVTKVKGSIKRPKDQKATLEALGLRKMNSSNEFEATPAVLGMIKKVEHLLKVENI
jgi:large subunit ribosomal protein L30